MNQYQSPPVNEQNKMWSSYYQQSCEAFRHYSAHMREVRIVTVVQGVTILAGTGYLINNNNLIPAACAIVFGILLTTTLLLLHRLYYRHCKTFLDYISNDLENGCGPYSAYKINRTAYLGKGVWLYTNCVFILIFLSLVFLLTADLTKLL